MCQMQHSSLNKSFVLCLLQRCLLTSTHCTFYNP
ncbi:hypothetical protein T03_2306 [Trichinella britovi]|uniref:Uncharacterized protein n=1 Tax=Trichinella britovi TaxID=45882 RepID=A0A0V1A2S0_TRIBR|nr:hypothetical protein T03_2306 [Trichinella britovi]